MEMEKVIQSEIMQKIRRDQLVLNNRGQLSESDIESKISRVELHFSCGIACSKTQRFQFATENSSGKEEQATGLATAALSSDYNIAIEKGNIATFKADILVNLIVSVKSDLSASGNVSKAFLDVGGDELKDEYCAGTIPTEFGDDVLQTRATGNLNAKFVFHAAFRKRVNSESVQRLQRLIEKCLHMASNSRCRSIAFPSLGCGSLGFSPDEVMDCFQRACQGSNLKITVVAFEQAVYDNLRQIVSGGCSHGSISSVSNENIRRSLGGDISRSLFLPYSQRQRSRCPNLHIEQGDLITFGKADSIFISICGSGSDLCKCGTVARALHDKHGIAIQMDFNRLSQRNKLSFGGDVQVSRIPLDNRTIVYGALGLHKDHHSLKMMEGLLKNCLGEVQQQSLSSIAFPSIGCGRLLYRPSDIVKLFQKVAAQFPQLQIYVVIKRKDVYESMMADQNSSRTMPSMMPRYRSSINLNEHANDDDEPVSPSQISSIRLTFDIATICPDTMRKVKQKLTHQFSSSGKTDRDRIRRADDVSGSRITIENYKIQFLTETDEAGLKKRLKPNCSIKIDRHKNEILLCGESCVIRGLETAVRDLLGKIDEKYLKANYGQQWRKTWLKMISESPVEDPKDWTTAKNYKLDPPSNVVKAVKELILNTWEAQKIGKGNDATGLNHSSIDVLRVFQIGHLRNFRRYLFRRKEMCLIGSENSYRLIKGQNGEWDIKTRDFPIPHVDLIEDINECLLFHGTKATNVEHIIKGGIDCRLSPGGMLGNGAYFAESSTKADQYADVRGQRSPAGTTLYMFIARVLLGNAFIPSSLNKLKRPPCLQCGEAICEHDNPADSVLCTHKQADTRFIFREFVVYDTAQCYPEFLIEYRRK